MEHPDLKSNQEVQKKIVMFMKSWYGTKCAAIFEFHIKLTCKNDVILTSDNESGQILRAIATFYDQRAYKGNDNPKIYSVAACVLGSRLYMFPDDRHAVEKIYRYDEVVDNRPTLKPCVYNLRSRKNRDIPVFPLGRKMGPIAAFVGTKKLFALSAMYTLLNRAPDPSFEVLDLNDIDTTSWRVLTSSPFQEHRFEHKRYTVTGYAVLGDNFILVSLQFGETDLIYYTYSFLSNKWKKTNPLVNMDGDNDTEELIYGPYIHNQAVVVGKHIYTYHPESLQLLVFSYEELAAVCSIADHDIKLGPAKVVQGLTYEENIDFLAPDFMATAAMAKLDDEIFCLLLTLTPLWSDLSLQKAHVTFIELQVPELCKTIKSFTFELNSGIQLRGLDFQSCHVMDDVEEEEPD